MNNLNIDQFFRRTLDRRRMMALTGSAGAAVLIASCSGKSSPSSGSTTTGDGSGEPETVTTADGTTVARPAGWSAESHSNQVDPDFDLVFPADKVNTMTITVPAETWTAMLANMVAIAGERGVAGAGGGGLGGRQQQIIPGQVPADGGIPPAGQVAADGQVPGNIPRGGQGQVPGGGGGGMAGGLTNPDWFKGTISFNGRSWSNVGVRFKGNSTLRSSWSSGTDAMPFKLDFDEWEGDHPEINNQRFYGFKQLSLSNNTGDPSYIRETVAYDFMEESGLPAANTALYDIMLDRGEGAKSLGIYTVIEVIDDTVLERVFEDGSGNIYEADGQAASLAAGTTGAIQVSFQAEGGENPDWSDIRALYNAIHSTKRTTDTNQWKKELEAVFDVDGFLNWLGIAAVIGHWDTYGGMSHNYYLYNDPKSGRMTFISWDHNFVMGSSMGGGGGGGQVPVGGAPVGGGAGGGRPNMSTSLDKNDVTESWPLIRWLMDDPGYKATYIAHMRKFLDGPFTSSKLTDRFGNLQKLIAANTPEATAQANATAMASLTTWAQARVETVKTFLATA